jgi:hypothetical protein
MAIPDFFQEFFRIFVQEIPKFQNLDYSIFCYIKTDTFSLNFLKNLKNQKKSILVLQIKKKNKKLQLQLFQKR